MIIRIEYEGWQSELFHSDYDRVVKRGILDIYELSDEPDEWVVLDPYIFWSSRIQKAVVVPRWFITDLSSIPKPARILISVNERHRIPSLPHDVLYTLKGVLSEDDTITKEEADLVFLDFLKLFNVPTWKAQSMYWAVRLGGHHPSNKN